jgi:hypothetical protein
MYWRRELVNWNNNGAPAKSNKINIWRDDMLKKYSNEYYVS